MKPFKIYKPVERRHYPGAILCTKFARNAGLGSTEFLQQSMILHIIQQAHRCILLYDLDKAVLQKLCPTIQGYCTPWNGRLN